MSYIVAIDGTAGTGKGTITKLIAKKMGLVNIDTGIFYRCVSLAMVQRNVTLDEKEKIIALADQITVEIQNKDGEQIVYLDGKEVTKEIRSKEVTQIVSFVSSIVEVREIVTRLERSLGQKYLKENKSIIMEGRDITTVVFPEAEVKIYMDASLEERVKRRIKENVEKGIDMSYEEVKENIQKRDENDKNKQVGALKIAKDAVVVDTTDKTIEEVQKRVEEIIKEKTDKKEEQQVKTEKEKKSIKKKEPISKRIQRTIVKGILKFLYIVVYRVKVEGKENVPEEGSFILCGNHVSYIKVPIVVLFNPRKVNFIAKAELFNNPILNWLGYLFDAIPVKRGKQDVESMKRSLKVINSGEVLGLFPEGTRNGLEKKVKVKNGAAYMAIRTGAPVLPVGIKVTKRPFPKVIVNFGKLLDYSEYKSKVPEKEVLEKTTNEIMDNIIKLTNEAK